MEGVDPSHDQLRAAGGQHEGAAVPANVIERVELVCHLWDGGGDDSAVEGNEEHGAGGVVSGVLSNWMVSGNKTYSMRAMTTPRVWARPGYMESVVLCTCSALGISSSGCCFSSSLSSFDEEVVGLS